MFISFFLGVYFQFSPFIHLLKIVIFISAGLITNIQSKMKQQVVGARNLWLYWVFLSPNGFLDLPLYGFMMVRILKISRLLIFIIIFMSKCVMFVCDLFRGSLGYCSHSFISNTAYTQRFIWIRLFADKFFSNLVLKTLRTLHHWRNEL